MLHRLPIVVTIIQNEKKTPQFKWYKSSAGKPPQFARCRNLSLGLCVVVIITHNEKTRVILMFRILTHKTCANVPTLRRVRRVAYCCGCHPEGENKYVTIMLYIVRGSTSVVVPMLRRLTRPTYCCCCHAEGEQMCSPNALYPNEEYFRSCVNGELCRIGYASLLPSLRTPNNHVVLMS